MWNWERHIWCKMWNDRPQQWCVCLMAWNVSVSTRCSKRRCSRSTEIVTLKLFVLIHQELKIFGIITCDLPNWGAADDKRHSNILYLIPSINESLSPGSDPLSAISLLSFTCSVALRIIMYFILQFKNKKLKLICILFASFLFLPLKLFEWTCLIGETPTHS